MDIGTQFPVKHDQAVALYREVFQYIPFVRSSSTENKFEKSPMLENIKKKLSLILFSFSFVINNALVSNGPLYHWTWRLKIDSRYSSLSLSLRTSKTRTNSFFLSNQFERFFHSVSSKLFSFPSLFEPHGQTKDLFMNVWG